MACPKRRLVVGFSPSRNSLNPVRQRFSTSGLYGHRLVTGELPVVGVVCRIWQIRLRFAVGNFELNKPLLLWINDGLMTVFFFVVGLEIKREFVMGELRDLRKAALPIVALLAE